MSGYRRYSKSRYGYRRRRYYSYRYRRYGMSTARKANIAYRSTRKRVKREEVKTHEDQVITNNVTSTRIFRLVQVPQGTTEDSRIGNSISPTSWKIKVHCKAHNGSENPIASNFTALYRILLVVWKGVGEPAITDILEADDINSMKNDQYKYNSKILYDKVHRLDSQVQERLTNIVIKRGLRRYPITYQGASSPITFRMNGYHMWIIPGWSSITGEVDMTVTSRLCFKDN